MGTGGDVFWYCGYWNSGYEHRDELSGDESPTAVGSSTASAAPSEGSGGRAVGKRSSERKCFASLVGRHVGPSEPEHGRGRIGGGS